MDQRCRQKTRRFQQEGEARRHEHFSFCPEGAEEGLASVHADEATGGTGEDSGQNAETERQMKSCAIVVGHNHYFGDSNYDKKFTRDFVLMLSQHNPEMDILLVDNFSARPYPLDIAPNVATIRILRRVGYAVALNDGLRHFSERGDYDWYVCFNNDNWINPNPAYSGNITDILQGMNPQVLYGSGENNDEPRKMALQWSAWLCISRQVFQAVGYFDEKLGAAFEDFDYELRAMKIGFTLDTAYFPIEHMDEHTRFEDKNYPMSWEKARRYFSLKHGIEMETWYKV
jgi:GT2 family glycosyltransferase